MVHFCELFCKGISHSLDSQIFCSLLKTLENYSMWKYVSHGLTCPQYESTFRFKNKFHFSPKIFISGNVGLRFWQNVPNKYMKWPIIK